MGYLQTFVAALWVGATALAVIAIYSVLMFIVLKGILTELRKLNTP